MEPNRFKPFKHKGKDFALVSERVVKGKIVTIHRCVDDPERTIVLKDGKPHDLHIHFWNDDNVIEAL